MTPADLSGLEVDLTQMFRPAWTVESAGKGDGARLAEQYDTGDRPERPRGRGRDREGAGPRRNREDRGPRREKRSSGEPGRRDRRDRGPQHRADRRPEPQPKPMLEGWKLELVPESAAIEVIAKQVRSRAKAYPLFELARLIIRLSERYSVRLQPESETFTGLVRVRKDGSLWPSRKEAVDHLLSKHLAAFYRSASVTTEPPKGSYTVIAECGMSGVLLGPPNHHAYQSRLLALHAARFRNMPFETYKSRIRMVRDEALMERWKTEQSTKTVYFLAGEGATDQPTQSPASDESSETPSAEAAPSEESDLPVSGDARDTEAPQEAPVAEPSGELPDKAENAGAENPEAATETPTTDTTADALPQTAPEGALSWEEAVAHFQQHHADAEIEPVEGNVTVPGHAALHGSTPLLREFLLKNLQELDRFPLPVAHHVSKELSNLGLQLFKAHLRKIVHVSMARPKYLDRTTTPIAENFVAILDYLEAHPKQARDKQWAGLLALRTETANTEEETRQHREKALGADLLWLLHQGHVIDFAMGNLQAATPPKPQPQKAPKQPGTTGNPAAENPSSGTAPTDPAPATPPAEAPTSLPSDTPGIPASGEGTPA